MRYIRAIANTISSAFKKTKPADTRIQIAQIENQLAELDNIEARAALSATQQQLLKILNAVKNTDDVEKQQKQLEQQLEQTIQQHIEQHRNDAEKALQDSVLNTDTFEFNDIFADHTNAIQSSSNRNTNNNDLVVQPVVESKTVDTCQPTQTNTATAKPTIFVPPPVTPSPQGNTILHQYKSAKPTALYTDHRDNVRKCVELSQKRYKNTTNKSTLSTQNETAVDNVMNQQNNQNLFFLTHDTRNAVLSYIKQHKTAQQPQQTPSSNLNNTSNNTNSRVTRHADPLEPRRQAIRQLRTLQSEYAANTSKAYIHYSSSSVISTVRNTLNPEEYRKQYRTLQPNKRKT